MKSAVLVLDFDSEIGFPIEAAAQRVLYASSINEAIELIEKSNSVISRVLINPRIPNLGTPVFKKILEVNPQASVWLILDHLDPLCMPAGRILGFHGVYVKTFSNPWVPFKNFRGVKDELVEIPLSFSMIQVFPAQLEHSDPLRFSLFCKTYDGFVRLFPARTPISSIRLSRIADPVYYVMKGQVMSLVHLLESFDKQVEQYPELSWQEQLVQFVTGPIALGIA